MKELFQIVFAVTGSTFVVVAGIWMMGIFRTSHTAPAPTFTCAQTISPDSAAILSADLWNRAQRNERTRIYFGCRDGHSFYRLERVR